MKPVLYTTHCPKCTVLSKKLEKANIEYDICEDTATMQSRGFTSLPVLEVNGEILDFSAAIKWVGDR